MVLCIAHRGVSYEAPENTLFAIQEAIALGVDLIEIDIHLTKDGIPVVIHDPSLDRTTSHKNIEVNDITFDFLKNIDAGSWFHKKFINERIPSLEQVLKAVHGKIGLMIEIKKGSHQSDEIVQAVLSTLKEFPLVSNCPIYIGSFDPDILSLLQKHHSPYELVGIVDELSLIDVMLEKGVKCLALWNEIITRDLVNFLIGKEKALWSFTIDSPAEAKRLIDLGIQAIITNNPRTMKNHL